jgi:hypothetical protein
VWQESQGRLSESPKGSIASRSVSRASLAS